jgi:hypothetical protein
MCRYELPRSQIIARTKKSRKQVRNNNKYTSMGSATQEMDGIPVSPRVGMYN